MIFFPRFKNEFGELTLKQTPKGLIWDSSMLPPKKNCVIKSVFDVKLAALLTKAKWEDFLKRCRIDINLKTNKKHKKYLNHNDLRIYFENILSIINRKDQFIHKDKLYLYFDAFPSLYFSNLGKLVLSLSSKNTIYTEKLMRKMITLNVHYFWFSVDESAIGDWKAFSNNFYKTIEFIIGKVRTTELSKIFISSFFEIFGKDEYFEKLQSQYNETWSLNEIRRLVKRRDVGQFLPAFWFTQLLSRSSLSEATSFLREVLNNDNLPYIDPLDFWLFKFYIPQDDRSSRMIDDVFDGLKRSKHPEVQYMLMEISENVAVRKKLNLGKSYFAYKRSVFNSFLKKGYLVRVSILNLLFLGERKENLLEYLNE